MKTLKSTLLALAVMLLVLPMQLHAQESEAKVTLEFKNAETAAKLIKNYTAAIQKGDVETMNAQLHKKAVIYGLGGGLDSLTVAEHKTYFSNSFSQYKHSIEGDLYLPVKVEDSWNEGEWLLSWGTNTITDKKTGQQIEIPYHTVSMVEDGKIVFMRYFYDMLNIVSGQGYTLTPPKE